MAKKSKKDIVLDNLKGFVRLGAFTNSPGSIPTGHFNLDFAIHYGMLPQDADLSSLDGYDPAIPLGVPLGKLIEIFGEEGGGKSSLAYRIVGYAQKMGHTTAWIDTENSFSSGLAKINGADEDNIYYADMTNKDDEDITYYAEDILDAIIGLCKSGVKIIVLDSVANMVPKVVFENSAEKQTIGVMARLLSQNLGKIANATAKYGSSVIFINQLREKIGVMWGSPETSPGGRSLKHNCSLRLQMTKRNSKEANIEVLDSEGRSIIVGRNSIVRIIKNRFAKPFFDPIDVPVYFEPYFPDIEDLLFDCGRQLKVISVYKGVFKWEKNQAEGKKAFTEMVKNKKLSEKLYQDLVSKAEEANSFLPPEITKWYNSTVEDVATEKDVAVKVVEEKEDKHEGENSGDREG